MVGTAAILAEKIDVSPKLWTHKTSKEGLKAATLANSHPIDVKIWKPKLTADATTAALNEGEDYELLFTVPVTTFEVIKNIKDVHIIGAPSRMYIA